jgi:hypothetical protein
MPSEADELSGGRVVKLTVKAANRLG